jgi:hypothetical protein
MGKNLRVRRKRSPIFKIISIIASLAAITYYMTQTMVVLPQAVETVSKFLSREQGVVGNVPTGVIGEVDYGTPIIPLKPLPHGSSVIIILTVGVVEQPLSFAQVFFSAGNEIYGPYLTDQNGMLIIPNIKGSNYSITGFYKGFTSIKKIVLPEGQRRLYKLSFPVYVEILGIPFELLTFIFFIIGIILLMIVLAVIVTEYSHWRRLRLLGAKSSIQLVLT